MDEKHLVGADEHIFGDKKALESYSELMRLSSLHDSNVETEKKPVKSSEEEMDIYPLFSDIPDTKKKSEDETMDIYPLFSDIPDTKKKSEDETMDIYPLFSDIEDVTTKIVAK